MIRLLTAGESHGPGISVIVDGVPSGVPFDSSRIDRDLARRQHGYGRGGRMKIEQDRVQVTAGVRRGLTTGAPVAFFIANKDYENWRETMALDRSAGSEPVRCPRPGHADLAGVLKYGLSDIRDVLERASARETCGRVAASGLFRILLGEFGVFISSRTVAVGGIWVRKVRAGLRVRDRSPLRCPDPLREKAMIRRIDQARRNGDTLGGVAEVRASGLCPGLGSHVQFDRRLDSRIGSAMLSIPSVKGIEIGCAWENSGRPGSEVQDEIFFSRKRGYFRRTNRCGGVEGGMTNGSDAVVRLAVKPIPTLARPLRSVDLGTGRPASSFRERADVCAVPAVGVIAEAMLAWVLADAYLEKFGSDCLADVKAAWRRYCRRITP